MPDCEYCQKTMSVNQAVVAVIPDPYDPYTLESTAHVYCLQCTVSESVGLDDDESVSVSVDLLKRLIDGVVGVV